MHVRIAISYQGKLHSRVQVNAVFAAVSDLWYWRDSLKSINQRNYFSIAGHWLRVLESFAVIKRPESGSRVRGRSSQSETQLVHESHLLEV